MWLPANLMPVPALHLRYGVIRGTNKMSLHNWPDRARTDSTRQSPAQVFTVTENKTWFRS